MAKAFLHSSGVDTCCWVYKLDRVVDTVVGEAMLSKTIVDTPLISIDYATRKDPTLNDREEHICGACISRAGYQEALSISRSILPSTHIPSL